MNILSTVPLAGRRTSPAARRIGAVAGLAVLCLLVVSCRGSGDSADRVIELTEIQSFDASDSLNNIRGMAVGPRSDLWVIGSPAPFVHHFDERGRLLGSFGRAGQGPGELSVPYEVFAPTPTDSLVRVWSPGRTVVSAFREDGSFVAATKLAALSPPAIPNWVDKIDYVRIRPMARWNDRYVVQDVSARVAGLTGVTQVANARLFVLDSSGAVVDTLLDFGTLSGPTRPAPTAMYLAAVPVWTTCPSGEAAVADPYGMRLLRFPAQGGPPRADTLPLALSPVTDDDIRRHLRHWMTVPEATPAGTVADSVLDWIITQYLGPRRAELGTVAPPVVRMLCDGDGALWLQRYDTADEPRGLSRDWVVVEDGRVVRRYRFPARFQPFTLHHGTAFGVQKDSLDVERVAAVRYGSP